jgi:hypothetical protein
VASLSQCRARQAAFELYLADNLLQLQTELQEKTYQPGAYHSFYIHEPKRRLISAAPYTFARDVASDVATTNNTVIASGAKQSPFTTGR